MSQSKQSFFDYDGFVEKFKPKRTTDDCYTPPEVMEVVNAYVERRWGLDRADFVRPFYPGGDYERFDYPDGCVVVDNPPFSILGRIRRFYMARGIPLFLFCPSLTAFSGWDERCDVIVCDADVTYENGAKVRTAFVTSLPSEYVAESEPALGDEVRRVCDELRHRASVQHPKYEYPDELLTAARLQWMAAHHTALRIRRGECCRVAALDSQRAAGKAVFGGVCCCPRGPQPRGPQPTGGPSATGSAGCRRSWEAHMAQTGDEPLSRAIMRAIGWCDGDGGHGTGAHMVSTETLMGWAARAVLLESMVGPSAPAIATYRPESTPSQPFATTCTTRIERNSL